MKFATGKNAWGRCMRCGDRWRLLEMVFDGQIPGLKVCVPCRDIKHPVEKPFNVDEGINLKHPAPDTDDDSAGATGTTLIAALGLTRNFGGGT